MMKTLKSKQLILSTLCIIGILYASFLRSMSHEEVLFKPCCEVFDQNPAKSGLSDHEITRNGQSTHTIIKRQNEKTISSFLGFQDAVIITGSSLSNPVLIPDENTMTLTILANTNNSNENAFHGVGFSLNFASLGVNADQINIDYSNSGMGILNSTMIVLDSSNGNELEIAMTKTNSNYTSGTFELCSLTFPISALATGAYTIPITITSANNSIGDNISCVGENILVNIENNSTCEDPNACNFQLAENCVYPPQENLDCEGNCINDENNNGVCDENEVFGCTDQNACNFNPEATTDNSSCVFEGPIFDCSGNCILDSDNDGICDQNEVQDGSSFCGTNTTWDPITQTCIGISSCPTDLNNDGLTNISDLFTLLGSFGLTCQ